MSKSHTGTVFNHSCLKVPVNPSNRLPSPSYERKRVSSFKDNGKTNRERARKNTSFSEFRRSSFSSPRKEITKGISLQKKTITPRKNLNENFGKESIESFLDFYESIPDYGDVNHLSDREFYLKIQNLKEKQRTYLKSVDEKYHDAHHEISPTIRNESERNSGKYRKTSSSPEKSYNDGLISSRYEMDNKSIEQQMQSKIHKISDSQGNKLFWSKFEDKREIITPTPETASITSIDVSRLLPNKSQENNSKLLGQTNEVSDSEDLKSKTGFNINNFFKKEKQEIAGSVFESHKMKGKKTKPITNKIRDTHSASSNKQPSNFTMDSASSIIESMWDGFSVDDYFPKSDYMFSDSDSAPDDTLPLSHSLPTSPVLKHNKNVAWKEPKITIPKPFKMTMREEEDRHFNTLRSQFYDSAVENKPVLKPGFRANPVPLHTRLPLYEKIMAEQEKRRKRLRRQCIAELKSQMKPFSFVKRDEDRWRFKFCRSTPELRDLEGTALKPFKAKPVPKNLFSTYVYQRMREDEFYRSWKKKIRAEEMLKASSLPPSMAAREELAKTRSVSTELLDDSDSDLPKRRRHKIPNYKKSHQMLQKELEARWNDNITTSPQPFHLKTEQRGRKSARFESPSNSPVSVSPYEGYSAYFYERLRPHSALSITPNRNNLAAILRIQSARQRLEHEVTAKQEECKKKEAARLKAHLTRRKPAWRALDYSMAEDLALRVQSRREEERLRREEYQQDMELMLSRVERIPTLFERQSKVMKKHRRSVSSCRHSDGSISLQNSPELYDDDREDVSEDKSSKMGLKVSINETAETIECKSEGGEVEQAADFKEELKEQESEPGEKEEEDGSESIPEEVIGEKSSVEDEENQDEDEDEDEDEDGDNEEDEKLKDDSHEGNNDEDVDV